MIRVIPRDLFNDGNLLKCYGKLYIELEKIGLNDLLIHRADNLQFEIVQNPDDGSTSITNITINGLTLSRPLNSRSEWPLYAEDEDGNIYDVFNERGNLSDEFISALIGLLSPDAKKRR